VTEVKKVGPEAFDGERIRARGRVAVAFLADWCPFCGAFEPEFRRLAAAVQGGFLLADVSADDSPLWDRFRVEIVPTVIVFHDGAPIYRADGVPGRGLGAEALDGVRHAMLRSTPTP